MQDVNNLFANDESFDVEAETLQRFKDPSHQGHYRPTESTARGRILSAQTDAVRNMRRNPTGALGAHSQSATPTHSSGGPTSMRDSWAKYNQMRGKLGQSTINGGQSSYNQIKQRGQNGKPNSGGAK